MESIFLFIAILAALVLVHEGGHFAAAKASGVRVDEFGLGFPPRLAVRKRGETEYSLNLLPFGGFVRVAGEDGTKAAPTQETSKSFFAFRPMRIKLVILLAGVAANWAVAALLFAVLQVAGSPIAVSDRDSASGARVVVAGVQRDSPAMQGGLAVGDVIVAAQAEGVELTDPTTIGAVQEFTRVHAGKEISLTLKRDGSEQRVALTPREQPPKGEGALGVALLRVVTVSHPWYEAPWRGAFVASSMTISLAGAFADLVSDFFKDGMIAEGLAGPVGIAALTGDAATLGFFALVNFIAVLSLNLALLNVLPFPALDGGRVAVAALEGVFRRPFPARGLALMHAAGFAILIVLLLAVTARDIRNLL